MKLQNSKKGLLEKISSYLESKILDKDLSDDQKAHKIIILTSCLCAVIATQPLPFADIFILTPIQIIMAGLLSKIRDKRSHENETAGKRIKELVEDIGLIVMGGQLAQYIAIGLYKIGLPFLGGFMTIPLVFGLTYGMGKTLDYYFKNIKQKSLKDNKEEIKKIFQESRKEGKKIIKKALDKSMWKKIKNILRDKNLSNWDRLKQAVELFAQKIEDQEKS